MKKSIMIVGTRTYEDYKAFKSKVDEWLNYNVNLNEDIIEIVSGGARGVDSLAERLANEENFLKKIFPADWNKFGKSAGPIRNRQMVEYIKEKDGVCLIFWDGQSRGTKNDIDLCNEYEVKYKVFDI